MKDSSNSSINTQVIRKDFPILERKNKDGKTLVYLDNSATSQKPTSVLKVLQDYYLFHNANIHRGIHTLAEEATELYETARIKVASFIKAKDPKEIIFTRNTTESINLVVSTFARNLLSEKDLILLTEMEHHSNLVPWYILANEIGFRIKFVPVNESGDLDLLAYERLLKENPKIVSFTHMSNVLGTINPAKVLAEMAHQVGSTVVVDGAQSVPHFPVNVQEINADFYAFSAHKMCGPTGVGALYGKKDLLEKMPPFLGGGDMIKKVTFEGFQANQVPYKFEAGTPAIAEVIGFGAAVDYLDSLGMEAVFKHERQITDYAIPRINQIDGVDIIGPPVNGRGGVISFTMKAAHPHDVAQILDSEGIAVRAGHHCAMPLHQRFNLLATTRASFYLYNTFEEVDRLVDGIKKVNRVFS